MRNRFKPNLNNSRAARSSSLSTNQSSAGDNAASSGLTANLQAQDSLKEGVGQCSVMGEERWFRTQVITMINIHPVFLLSNFIYIR